MFLGSFKNDNEIYVFEKQSERDSKREGSREEERWGETERARARIFHVWAHSPHGYKNWD